MENLKAVLRKELNRAVNDFAEDFMSSSVGYAYMDAIFVAWLDQTRLDFYTPYLHSDKFSATPLMANIVCESNSDETEFAAEMPRTKTADIGQSIIGELELAGGFRSNECKNQFIGALRKLADDLDKIGLESDAMEAQ